jgi:FkbM family methyltransferase
MDWSGFLYRRLSRFITCTFLFSEQRKIKLLSKHHLSSFQDVFANPFYWDVLTHLPFVPKNVLDLGANLGYFSLLVDEFRRYKHAVPPAFILVEANPFLIKKIENNLQYFGIQQYEIVHAVAGPLGSSVKFYVDKEHTLSSSINKQKNSKELNIPTFQFNNYDHTDIDIIKIDIEGAEYELVKNYAPKLAKAKCLIFELHGNQQQNEALINEFLNKGFRIGISTKEPQTGYQLLSFQKD